MKQLLSTLFVGLMISQTAHAADLVNAEVIGHISNITRKFVEINDKKYPLLRGDSENLKIRQGEATECWYQYRITCGTLADSGYFDKAKVTIRNGLAIRIEVLEHRP